MLLITFKSCDLPIPGSPIINTFISQRLVIIVMPLLVCGEPPKRLKIKAALTNSWPYMEGQSEATRSFKRLGVS